MVRGSMAGWATLWLGGIALAALGAHSVARHFIESPWMAAVVAALVLTPLVAWSGTILAGRWSHMARALNDGIASLKDRDFSVSVTPCHARRDGRAGDQPTTPSAIACAWSARASTSAS